MNQSTTDIVRLSEMISGETGIIRSVENNNHYLNLLEMGFLPGEKIAVENTAPLRDPISVRVADYQVSLRKEEATCIIVERTMNEYS
jgi:ferrous iron transport protein A